MDLDKLPPAEPAPELPPFVPPRSPANRQPEMTFEMMLFSRSKLFGRIAHGAAPVPLRWR